MTAIKFLRAFIITSAFFVYYNVSAQDTDSGFTKNKTLEVSTGFPSILFNFDFPGTQKSVDLYMEGKGINIHSFQPCINIAYVNNWRKRWELSTILNLHISSYDVYLLDNPAQYDRVCLLRGSLSMAFRYKWLLKEKIELYSALGLGISATFPLPLPYLAPIGMKFGKGKVYGLVELNMSPTSSLGIAGIGIRL